MAYPDIATLTNIFLPDGFGAFGYGDGGYGGGSEILNPQWNTNAGVYGLDPASGLPFVAANGTPSYIGASRYSILNSAFFAQITPAGPGNGSITTAIIVKQDNTNYVEMSIGPGLQFNAYVANNTAITTSSPSMPVYNPTTHAFWRIRNDGSQFYFDTAPDGATWTQQGSCPYNWDASAVTVTIYAAYTGVENPGNIALINNVNLPNTTLALQASTGATAAVDGLYEVIPFGTLSGNVNGKAGFKANFGVSLGIPQGGLTDWIFNSFIQQIDPLIVSPMNTPAPNNVIGTANTILQSTWLDMSYAFTVPSPYRDGSYFQPAAYTVANHLVTDSTTTGPIFMTNNQFEETSGFSNRLPLNASIFTDSCPYTPGFGSNLVERSTAFATAGPYSAKMTSSGSAITLGNGALGYMPLPARSAMTPVIQSGTTIEAQFATVALSTARANTNWFASFVFYDVNFNILSASTYQQSSITNINVHPGGNTWQTGATQLGTVLGVDIPLSAAWSSVVPVVIVPTSSLVETVYFSTNSVYGGSQWFTESGTDYSNPRTANINVKADRVNYAMNGGFNTGIKLWSQVNTNTTGTPHPASVSWDGTVGFQSLGSMKFFTNAISGSFTGGPGAQIGIATNTSFGGAATQPLVQGLVPGNTYTISAWINQGVNCPDVYMNFYDANFNGVESISTNQTKIDSPQNVSGNWTRVQTTYTVPPNGLQDYGMFFYVNFVDMVHAPFRFWVDDILVEETTEYNGFFDGGFASSDYQWESGATPNLCKAYYYKDYADKFNRLNSSLSSVLPIGESYNLLFAQPIVST